MQQHPQQSNTRKLLELMTSHAGLADVGQLGAAGKERLFRKVRDSVSPFVAHADPELAELSSRALIYLKGCKTEEQDFPGEAALTAGLLVRVRFCLTRMCAKLRLDGQSAEYAPDAPIDLCAGTLPAFNLDSRLIMRLFREGHSTAFSKPAGLIDVSCIREPQQHGIELAMLHNDLLAARCRMRYVFPRERPHDCYAEIQTSRRGDPHNSNELYVNSGCIAQFLRLEQSLLALACRAARHDGLNFLYLNTFGGLPERLSVAAREFSCLEGAAIRQLNQSVPDRLNDQDILIDVERSLPPVVIVRRAEYNLEPGKPRDVLLLPEFRILERPVRGVLCGVSSQHGDWDKIYHLYLQRADAAPALELEPRHFVLAIGVKATERATLRLTSGFGPDGEKPPALQAAGLKDWQALRQAVHEALRATGSPEEEDRSVCVFSLPSAHRKRTADDLARELLKTGQAAFEASDSRVFSARLQKQACPVKASRILLTLRLFSGETQVGDVHFSVLHKRALMDYAHEQKWYDFVAAGPALATGRCFAAIGTKENFQRCYSGIGKWLLSLALRISRELGAQSFLVSDITDRARQFFGQYAHRTSTYQREVERPGGYAGLQTIHCAHFRLQGRLPLPGTHIEPRLSRSSAGRHTVKLIDLGTCQVEEGLLRMAAIVSFKRGTDLSPGKYAVVDLFVAKAEQAGNAAAAVAPHSWAGCLYPLSSAPAGWTLQSPPEENAASHLSRDSIGTILAAISPRLTALLEN